MTKKIRIAILYNQPVTGDREQKASYVNEKGKLQAGAQIRRGEKRTFQELIDLSEVGVVDEMDDIKEALNSIGYSTTTFNVDSDAFRLFDYLRNDRPDMIFNLVECLGNESIHEMHVAGVYELLKIPYTGAGPTALGLALNKPRVKELLTHHGIRTPRFKAFGKSDKVAPGELKFPLIVKPSGEDASVGIDDRSVVYNPAELRRRVQYIIEEFAQPALVEEYVNGRELNVAILGSLTPVVLPISEIDFSGLTADMHKIVSYEAKWIQGTVAYEGTKGVCPAPLTTRQEADLKATALRCFGLIGCRDYARVDFRLSSSGVPYVLEVNPNPDISADAGFARSTRVYGLTYPESIGKIVESALERTRV
jgi:D-alanine-D-alanine ligase